MSDAAGFVLAGGRSSRMGSDKALVRLDGKSLIEIALRTFSEAGLSARIAGSRSHLAKFGPVIPDRFPESGPLGGVHAGLAVTAAHWNLFLPVDMPLLPSSLLRVLIQRARLTGAPVTTVRLNGVLQPFPVVLTPDVLPLVEELLASGQLSCQRAWRTIPEKLSAELDAVSVESLVQCDLCHHPSGLPPVFWYQSANTPAELDLLRRLKARKEQGEMNLDATGCTLRYSNECERH